METRFWPPIIILAVLVGGIFLFRHLDIVDRANAGYLEARDSLATMEEAVRVRQKQWEDISGAVGQARAKLADANARHEKAAAVESQAVSLQHKLESELNYLVTTFPGLIEKVRSDALGVPLPSVTLADGKVLSNAQIKKIDDNGIAFIHDGGFDTVPVSSLPVELVEKFDIGPTSITKTAQQLKEEADRAPVTPTNPDTSPASIINNTANNTSNVTMAAPSQTSSSRPSDTKVDEKLKALRIKMVAVQAQIRAVSANKANWETVAARASEMAADAKYRGTPTSKFRSEEANARTQIGLCVQQTAQLESELGRLQVEENSLISSLR
jgi:lipoprotein-anchoring transpeptidase ErfK/SrfK